MRAATALALLALVSLPAGAAGAADAGAEAAASYAVEASAEPARLKVGGQGTLTVAIKPSKGAHVHPQAPLKVALGATPGLSLARAELGRKDLAEPAAEAPRFRVPFTAAAAGAQEARARVDFFICSDRWCVKQVRELTVAVTVE
jgi:hypothetical protein